VWVAFAGLTVWSGWFDRGKVPALRGIGWVGRCVRCVERDRIRSRVHSEAQEHTACGQAAPKWPQVRCLGGRLVSCGYRAVCHSILWPVCQSLGYQFDSSMCLHSQLPVFLCFLALFHDPGCSDFLCALFCFLRSSWNLRCLEKCTLQPCLQSQQRTCSLPLGAQMFRSVCVTLLLEPLPTRCQVIVVSFFVLMQWWKYACFSCMVPSYLRPSS
jgi:hypothetical protein